MEADIQAGREDRETSIPLMIYPETFASSVSFSEKATEKRCEKSIKSRRELKLTSNVSKFPG